MKQKQAPISTIRERCRICYACIRNCPTKAIGIFKDAAEIIPHRCIGCGTCIQVCSQQAKVLADAIRETEGHLKGKHPVVAVLGCSFPGFFHDLDPAQMVTALHKLGFDEVLEGAAGAELIAPAYQQALDNESEGPLISSHCPSITELIERHYPQLIKNLAPVVSPMIAIGRFIKTRRGSKTKVVYISSCIGGKFEILSDSVKGAIDTVLTYAELNLMLRQRKIDPSRLKQSPMSGPPTSKGRSFSIIGGPLHNFDFNNNRLDPDVISTVGKQNSIDVIRDLVAGRLNPRFVDVRFCQNGCVGGPARTNRLTPFSKRKRIIDYINQEIPYDTPQYYQDGKDINLERSFSNKMQVLERPNSEIIKRILLETDKFSEDDELNCGSCGYPTCRDHAIAIYQGLADKKMCLPYSIRRLEQDRTKLEQQYQLARRALDQEHAGTRIIGDDHHTQGVLHLIKQVGPTPTTVLIRGESGTGKELTARAIHEASQRADKPMVTVNCTTLSDDLLESELFGHKKGSFTGAIAEKKGLFETANGGTIFLDEIGDITSKLQAELLRVLDNGEVKPVGSTKTIEVDVRVIAATNRPLEEGITKGWFREDLFYRLNVFTITLPPLRSRLSALPKLIDHFIINTARRLGKAVHSIDNDARRALSCYQWPGNIRELQNIIERAIVLTPDQAIHLEQLPVALAQLLDNSEEQPIPMANDLKTHRKQQINKLETEVLVRFLTKTKGNVSAAARMAGIPRRSFYRMMERSGIERQRFT
jgi:transcriptional regulator with PAS, ATPase and Fis domain/iron only hydrogenase large subunit-like protein